MNNPLKKLRFSVGRRSSLRGAGTGCYRDSHYIIREVTRIKIQVYAFASSLFLLLIIIMFIDDGLSLFLSNPRSFYIGIGFPICVFLIIRELRAIPNKREVVFSVDKEGVLLRVKGKRIKIKRNTYNKSKRDSYIYTEDRLMSFEWSDIEQIGLRYVSLGYSIWLNIYVGLSGSDKNSDKEVCVYVKSKTRGESLCSLNDYIWWIPLSARRIRRVVFDCTGRTDLFVDETRQSKE